MALAAPVSARYFPISVSVCGRLVRYATETGLWSRISRVRPTSAARLVAARSSRSTFCVIISVYRRLLKTRTSGARLRQVDHNGGNGLTPVLIEKPLLELVRCSSTDVAGLVANGRGSVLHRFSQCRQGRTRLIRHDITQGPWDLLQFRLNGNHPLAWTRKILCNAGGPQTR